MHLQPCVPQIGGMAGDASSPLPRTTLGNGAPVALVFTRLMPLHKLMLLPKTELDATLPAIVCFSLTDDGAILTGEHAVHAALQRSVAASADPTTPLHGSEKPVFLRLADLASDGGGRGSGDSHATAVAPSTSHIFLQVVEASGAWCVGSMQQSGEPLPPPAATSSAAPPLSSPEPGVRCAANELRVLLHGAGGRAAREAVARLSASWERGGGEAIVDALGGKGEVENVRRVSSLIIHNQRRGTPSVL